MPRPFVVTQKLLQQIHIYIYILIICSLQWLGVFPWWMGICSSLCPYQHWVMIHMLVRDGQRRGDASWPVREMWQRVECRDKPESVACSSQSLQGLVETRTGSCLPSLSFISFAFKFPQFLHLCRTFSTLPFPSSCSSFHVSLVTMCLLLADFTHSHTRGSSQTIPPLVLASLLDVVCIHMWPICGHASLHQGWAFK